MLLNEITKIKLSKKNIEHFKSLGYDGELKDVIEVSTMDINHGSHLLIDVKCDICGNVKKILFQKYIKNPVSHLRAGFFVRDTMPEQPENLWSLLKFSTFAP